MSRTTRVAAAVAASVIGATGFAGVANASEVAPSPAVVHLAGHSDHHDRDRHRDYGLVGNLLHDVGSALRPVVRAVL